MLIDGIMQPSAGATLTAIQAVLKREPVTHIDVAAAYVTVGGVQDLVNAIESVVGKSWGDVRKRWLSSFDYSRTEPLAIDLLRSIKRSDVRIHDGHGIIARCCIPHKPFHPKTFLFRGKGFDCVLSGSGNLSRSGLSRGHEAGLVLAVPRPAPVGLQEAARTVASFRSWYNALWHDGAPLDDTLLERYRKLYESSANLSHPTPTEDDVAPITSSSSSIAADDLRKLRACRHLWIEAGNVTRNRGKFLPGNQLMMKRLSRVFFGVPPTLVPHNSPLTELWIAFGTNESKRCSLTFSDNGMDKLTLPIPGAGGPSHYDGETLLFRRIGLSRFQLSLGSVSEGAAWLRKSRALEGDYKMPSGRKWGVF